MTDGELEEFLSTPRLCAFATVDGGGRPRVRPLWFLWQEGEFWFTTRLRARHTGRDLDTSPRVAVSIASEERPYRAVVAHGKPEVIDNDRDMLLAIATRYGYAPGRRWLAVAMSEPDRVLLRMRPNVLMSWDYGKRS